LVKDFNKFLWPPNFYQDLKKRIAFLFKHIPFLLYFLIYQWLIRLYFFYILFILTIFYLNKSIEYYIIFSEYLENNFFSNFHLKEEGVLTFLNYYDSSNEPPLTKGKAKETESSLSIVHKIGDRNGDEKEALTVYSKRPIETSPSLNTPSSIQKKTKVDSYDLDNSMYYQFCNYLREKNLLVDNNLSNDQYINYFNNGKKHILNQIKSYDVPDCESYINLIDFTDNPHINKRNLIDAIINNLPSLESKDIFLEDKNNESLPKLILLPKDNFNCDHAKNEDESINYLKKCECLIKEYLKAMDTSNGITKEDLEYYEPFLIRKDFNPKLLKSSINFNENLNESGNKAFIHKIYKVTKKLIVEDLDKVKSKGIGIIEKDSLFITSQKLNYGPCKINCGGGPDFSNSANVPLMKMRYSHINALGLNIAEVRNINPFIVESLNKIIGENSSLEIYKEKLVDPLSSVKIVPSLKSKNYRLDDPRLIKIEDFLLKTHSKENKLTNFDLELNQIHIEERGSDRIELQIKLITFYDSIEELSKKTFENTNFTTNNNFSSSTSQKDISILIDGLQLNKNYLKENVDSELLLVKFPNHLDRDFEENFLLAKNFKPDLISDDSQYIYKIYSSLSKEGTYKPLFIAANENQINSILYSNIKLDKILNNNKYLEGNFRVGIITLKKDIEYHIKIVFDLYSNYPKNLGNS
jgi:hypothetical protein